MNGWIHKYPALTVALAVFVNASLYGAEINVFAAASLTDSLKEIAVSYENQVGDKVLFNFGASSLLARQIEEGAPADIFFSADEAKMDGLEKKGLIVTASRTNRLSNSLVIIVAWEGHGTVVGPKDLSSANVKHLALAEPRTVPAGVYAKEYLQRLGIWSSVESKVVPMENVRAALSAVESGNAEAGIVYRTDAAISKKVKVAYEVPAAEGPAIRYPMALVKESKHPAVARKFLDHLNSRHAARVFAKHGFIVRN